MTTQIISRSFRFLTPGFPHGAYQALSNNIPELRAASIRGQLRWWWRTLGYGSGDEVFGSIAGNNGIASKVQVRLISPAEIPTCDSQILPHKPNPGHRGNKRAIPENRDLFTIELRPVRAGVTDEQFGKLQSTLEAWMLMGAVGQRANRSAGSVWPEMGAPISAEDYLSRCRILLRECNTRVSLLNIQFHTSSDLRRLSGKFLMHKPNARQESDRITVPGVVFGSAGSRGNCTDERKSSSLKLRAVRFGNSLHIAALWCPKDANDTSANLRSAIAQMKQVEAKEQLAILLQAALPDLCD